MKEILFNCLYLGILVLVNIACSVFYNINVKDIKFDIFKLLNGLYKGVIIACSFVALAFVLQQMPSISDAIGVQPKALMIASIVYYFKEAMTSLINCVKVKVVKDKEIAE